MTERKFNEHNQKELEQYDGENEVNKDNIGIIDKFEKKTDYDSNLHTGMEALSNRQQYLNEFEQGICSSNSN